MIGTEAMANAAKQKIADRLGITRRTLDNTAFSAVAAFVRAAGVMRRYRRTPSVTTYSRGIASP